MTDYKPQELAATTTLIGADVVQVETAIAGSPISKYITVTNLRAQVVNFLTTALTSTSWDGDAFSTTAKTVIDLSAVFAVPAGVRAVLVTSTIRDSGSSGGDFYLCLSPTSTGGVGMFTRCSYMANDAYVSNTQVVPCDASGDIYYQVLASGAGTMDVIIKIWGYWY
jgi:hypothetical protein